MAYAWCLDEGYAGIVTIDGNGKDGVEAIDAFVAKLEAGFAYVQGSRYRPGGEAVNTPLERKIAGRLIHAPLLSLAGRRWYTDTTNGFRAYSAVYLGRLFQSSWGCGTTRIHRVAAIGCDRNLCASRE